MEELLGLVRGLPNFAQHAVAATVSALAFLWIYSRITPWHEMKLIREGNAAAAVSFGGAFIGFCMPVANVMAHSTNVLDFLLWALVALIVQVVVHVSVRLLIGDLIKHIEEGVMASAVFAAALSLGFGLLNAACLTY
ncbi:MAG: DUF350 domain-containing protein [Rhodospirillales bacterium]|nr:DUF350 domain-containing protein [Rhodospirillales bacterium]QQS12624.1 MAG: DUF350 domain-containing protein [Rhodospirillales bacterium]